MSNKPLTAVDWLLQQFDEEKTPRQWEEVYKQAKELEKQQIIDAWSSDRQFIIYDSDNDGLSQETINELSEQYYNETYGND